MIKTLPKEVVREMELNCSGVERRIRKHGGPCWELKAETRNWRLRLEYRERLAFCCAWMLEDNRSILHNSVQTSVI